MTMKKGLLTAAAAMATVFAAAGADAAVTIEIAQVGTNVVARASGTFDVLAARFYFAEYSAFRSISSRSGFVEIGAIGLHNVFELSGPASFGTADPLSKFDEFTGTAIGLFAGDGAFYLSNTYANNSAISATGTMFNRTFASLGLTAGTYSYQSGSNAVTLRILPTAGAVPEPASWALMIAGVGIAGGALRRRRMTSTTVTFA